MPATVIRGRQVLDGSIQRVDLDTATAGQAVTTKIVQGTNITIASSGIDPGTGDVTISATGPNAGFVSKTSAYTIVSGDIGRYFICSGGSWTLTLPSASLGFCVYVRNDMGISGTTGTITIARAGSATIDGLTSIALLPGQDCQIACDGTNWRTFGLKREVILGTQDITSSTANGVVLLPVGFRYFELNWTSYQPVTTVTALSAQLSINGGSTWLTGSAYLNGLIYANSATATAYQNTTDAFIRLCTPATSTGQCSLKFYPSDGTRLPSWLADSEGYNTGISAVGTWRVQGFYQTATGSPVNALQYFAASGNISNSFLTVKGVV